MTVAIKVLVNFNGSNGADPLSGLIVDAAGNLFGTTLSGGTGALASGTVFEIKKTAGVYASTPSTLVSFNFANGAVPMGALLADAKGNLFGTTFAGGTNSFGTVFEIAKTGSSYAGTPTTLVSFNVLDGSLPEGGLVADAKGNLFGTTTTGGTNGKGTVFEIAKTGSGYASTPTVLASLSSNGIIPVGNLFGNLFVDAGGDLFGTILEGGANNLGTVFEIKKTANGYAGTPTTLVNFNNANGAIPTGSLIADTSGDLFGTTFTGGVHGEGTVFEIKKTAGGYASSPTTLVSFNSANGTGPVGGLIADANGNLFGTTTNGGANGDGTVFEIVKTASGYAGTPTVLLSFNGSNGSHPFGGLTTDASGNLFGTTSAGGTGGKGTAFEIIGAFAYAGKTYTLTTGADTVTGGGGNDTIIAGNATLNAGDHIDGGGGTNTLVLSGGGSFDLSKPTQLADIQFVSAAEGQVGAPAAKGVQTIWLRNGLNLTVNVASGTKVAGNTSAETITIHGAFNNDVINLGKGTDTVVIGGTGEVVNSGGGTALVQATAALAGALVKGTANAANKTTLELTTGGTAALNANTTNATVQLDAATNLTLGQLGFITVAGKVATLGGDTIKQFLASDKIDITDLAPAGITKLSLVHTPLSTSQGSLEVSYGTHTLTIGLAGSSGLTSLTPQAAGDGHGGTLISFH